MPSPDNTTFVAIAFNDGTIGRMQFFNEPTTEAIQAAIDTSFPGKVSGWKISSHEELAPVIAAQKEAQRAARVEAPKPAPSPDTVTLTKSEVQSMIDAAVAGFASRLAAETGGAP